MTFLDLVKISFHRKIIGIFIALLAFSSIGVGMVGYFIAKDALVNKSEVVLKNGVTQAMMLIDSEFNRVNDGTIDFITAAENIKSSLLGPLNEDGTRVLHGNVNLGENGYFIIYDLQGNEIMHPTLEGKNVWEVVDFSDKEQFVVQEQIDAALTGEGYSYYSWLLPHSEKIGNKISYAVYDEKREWVVVATAYELDFDAENKYLILAIFITILVVLTVASLIVFSYIKSVTEPIIHVKEGMAAVQHGTYDQLDIESKDEEIAILIAGYNDMIETLKFAEMDIEEHQERLMYLAYHDDLTNLSNRNGFKRFAENELSGNCKIGYLVQMDVLGLKEINSTLGYEHGDKLLAYIAAYFLSQEDAPYYVARTSSNEFSLWIKDMNYMLVEDYIYNVRDEIKEYIKEKDYNHPIDMHISLTVCANQDLDFDKMFEEATMAMKVAKEDHDMMIKKYNPDMRLTLESDILLRKHLHQAIIDHEIVPYYQEKINYETKKVVGVEALARWQSEELGFVSPGVFIPGINKFNLMAEFSIYILEKVLQDYPRLVKKYDNEISISINISPSFFIQDDFVDKINETIEKYDVPSYKIVLELTEDVFIANLEDIASKVLELHKIGLKVSIDDFGTGYSSLNYLINVNFDEMKIDKAFIDQIIEDEKVFKIFKILCNIADVYGFDIVAEGVETQAQLDKIKDTSLNIIQGYLFSKPKPLE